MSTHVCPGGCGASIPDTMLACRPHWHQLPDDVRDAICRTKDLAFLDSRRQSALRAAVTVYGDAAPAEWRVLLS